MSSQKQAADALKPGDHVEWKAPVPGGKTEGDVVEVVTHDTDVKSNHFKASSGDPKIRVKSSKSGKEAVHKPTSVTKLEDGGDEEEEEEIEDEDEEDEEEEQ